MVGLPCSLGVAVVGFVVMIVVLFATVIIFLFVFILIWLPSKEDMARQPIKRS